jgi:aryl-alcohol dehydrogenase-like predicted oxidoreductase
LNIGLGTVQFGLDYGVSNTAGRTLPVEVERLLEVASSNDIRVLDTAALYGASEEVLGACLRAEHGFDIVTKTAQFRHAVITKEDARHLGAVFSDSLRKLRQDKVYGLLVHHADDLLAEGGEYLMDSLLAFKSRGLVDKVGVSVYDGGQIEQILDRYAIDLVQLPVNVLDQRLLESGKLKQLKANGVEIHARSLFLQGLLLMPSEQIADYFAPLKQQLGDYHAFLKSQGLSLLQGALAFAASCKEIDEIILGVCSTAQLADIVENWRRLPSQTFDFARFACEDMRMINPALWHSLR